MRKDGDIEYQNIEKQEHQNGKIPKHGHQKHHHLRICWNMHKYAHVCKSMHMYAKACTSMQKHAQVCKSMHKYAKKTVCTKVCERESSATNRRMTRTEIESMTSLKNCRFWHFLRNSRIYRVAKRTFFYNG
jgi:hypothetical protein